MSKENGGPAFPVEVELGVFAHGVTVRDYFAAKALGALVGSSRPGGWHVGPTGNDNEWLAAASYGLSDVMIAERAK